MNTHIIGLVGRKQSGKDTVFRMIRELGIDAYRAAFADALKCEVYDELRRGGMPVVALLLEDGQPLTSPPEGDATTIEKVMWIDQRKDQFRHVLQCYGTDYRRRFFGDRYWIDRAAETIYSLRGQCEVIVVTDVRFPNEASYIKECGGTVIRIDRWPGLWAWLKRKLLPEHKSECVERIAVDYVIKNNGTLGDLREWVRNILTLIQVKAERPGN